METSRTVLRWVCLLGFVALGFIYLNSTLFSLWAAGGPPTEAPNAWFHRALVHFGFAITSFVSGFFIFRVIKVGYVYRGSRAWRVWLLIVVVALGWPPLKKFLEIDSCLDLGGRWTQTLHECEESDT